MRAVQFSPSGEHLLTAGTDKTLKVYSCDGTTSGARFRRTFSGHANWVRTAAWSPDGATLLSGSDDSTVRTWDAATGACTGTLYDHADAVLACAFSPDGRTFTAGGREGTIKVWDARAPPTAALLMHFPAHSGGTGGGVGALAWHPSGAYLLSTGLGDGALKVYDMREGHLLYDIHAHKAAGVHGVCFSAEGALFATGGGDESVHIWRSNFALGEEEGGAAAAAAVAGAAAGAAAAGAAGMAAAAAAAGSASVKAAAAILSGAEGGSSSSSSSSSRGALAHAEPSPSTSFHRNVSTSPLAYRPTSRVVAAAPPQPGPRQQFSASTTSSSTFAATPATAAAAAAAVSAALEPTIARVAREGGGLGGTGAGAGAAAAAAAVAAAGSNAELRDLQITLGKMAVQMERMTEAMGKLGDRVAGAERGLAEVNARLLREEDAALTEQFRIGKVFRDAVGGGGR